MSLAEKKAPSAVPLACTGEVRATCHVIHDTLARVRANTISMFHVMHLVAGEDRAREAAPGAPGAGIGSPGSSLMESPGVVKMPFLFGRPPGLQASWPPKPPTL